MGDGIDPCRTSTRTISSLRVEVAVEPLLLTSKVGLALTALGLVRRKGALGEHVPGFLTTKAHSMCQLAFLDVVIFAAFAASPLDKATALLRYEAFLLVGSLVAFETPFSLLVVSGLSGIPIVHIVLLKFQCRLDGFTEISASRRDDESFQRGMKSLDEELGARLFVHHEVHCIRCQAVEFNFVLLDETLALLKLEKLPLKLTLLRIRKISSQELGFE